MQSSLGVDSLIVVAKVLSQSCFCAFSVLMSLHLLSIIKILFLLFIIRRRSAKKIIVIERAKDVAFTNTRLWFTFPSK